ncbi:MAG: glycosyltransferase [Puniceicoccales bacterium]|jgi:glycosyltransferase involved in cell wall biosynthesis|nr:glycosyltransferase [Puniceicoccales bacterium]
MQESNLLFSVAVPVRNGEKYLRQCLESVRRQDVPPDSWQCICVDDGSSDGSGKILEEFALGDSRFAALKNIGSGVGAARNTAIGAARGKFIAFLDCDDLVEVSFLGELGALAEKFSAEIVGCCHENFNGAGEPHCDGCSQRKRYSDTFANFDRPLKALLSKKKKNFHGNGLNNYFVWGRLFRRDFLEKNKLLFSPIAIGEDTLFSLQAFHLASRFALIGKVLHRHRKHGESTMGSYRSIDYMENCIAVASAATEWFAGRREDMDGDELQLLHRAINKIIYEGCIRGRHGRGHWTSFLARRKRLRELRENGLFNPKALSLRHRIRSEIFLTIGL